MCQTMTIQNDLSTSLSMSRKATSFIYQNQLGVEGDVKALSYGQCDECACPAFAGQGTYCARTSCGHHWKSHKSE